MYVTPGATLKYTLVNFGIEKITPKTITTRYNFMFFKRGPSKSLF